ncbi:hypothetical protein DFH06DRAFT_1134831 [Mycena polygramma]|nr:hypothetical protein DFH06DRAFT_1134831 [Mycena polygramma]
MSYVHEQAIVVGEGQNTTFARSRGGIARYSIPRVPKRFQLLAKIFTRPGRQNAGDRAIARVIGDTTKKPVLKEQRVPLNVGPLLDSHKIYAKIGATNKRLRSWGKPRTRDHSQYWRVCDVTRDNQLSTAITKRALKSISRTLQNAMINSKKIMARINKAAKAVIKKLKGIVPRPSTQATATSSNQVASGAAPVYEAFCLRYTDDVDRLPLYVRAAKEDVTNYLEAPEYEVLNLHNDIRHDGSANASPLQTPHTPAEHSDASESFKPSLTVAARPCSEASLHQDAVGTPQRKPRHLTLPARLDFRPPQSRQVEKIYLRRRSRTQKDALPRPRNAGRKKIERAPSPTKSRLSRTFHIPPRTNARASGSNNARGVNGTTNKHSRTVAAAANTAAANTRAMGWLNGHDLPRKRATAGRTTRAGRSRM